MVVGSGAQHRLSSLDLSSGAKTLFVLASAVIGCTRLQSNTDRQAWKNTPGNRSLGGRCEVGAEVVTVASVMQEINVPLSYSQEGKQHYT